MAAANLDRRDNLHTMHEIKVFLTPGTSPMWQTVAECSRSNLGKGSVPVQSCLFLIVISKFVVLYRGDKTNPTTNHPAFSAERKMRETLRQT